MYCSTAFTLARCNNDVMPNNLKDALEKLFSTQYEPEVFPCSSTISQKMKRGRPITSINRISGRQTSKSNVRLGSHLVFSFHGNYDQCIQNSCERTCDDTDDCDEDKPAVNVRGCMIHSSLRGQSTFATCPRCLWGFTWIHILFCFDKAVFCCYHARISCIDDLFFITCCI